VAVTIYGTVGAPVEWSALQQAVGSPKDTGIETYSPWPLPGSVQATYLNKCVDGITGEWHFWETFFQDRAGVYYDGQQFDSATYKVEAIVYSREQV